jgi:F420-dependent oxidoreductase-like protein
MAGQGMKLATVVPYDGDFRATARQVVAMEAAGLDTVFVPEAYSFDAVSQVGYLASLTERLEIGTGIVNVYSRSPALLGMTAAGCDYVTGGRFFLGLGASGPQVIEGFHAIPYDRPLARTREVIDVVRAVLRREVVRYDGKAVTVPLPPGTGTGLGRPLKLINKPLRARVPIWWAALMPGAVQATAEVADGWIPMLYVPELAGLVWDEPLKAGLAKRQAGLGPLDIVAGGRVAIGDNLDVTGLRDGLRPFLALYIGGMGARGKNFYNDIAAAYGYGDAAREIQDHYLAGRKREAEAAVPARLLESLTLIGPAGYVRDRVQAFRDAGVTYLNAEPVGPDPVRTIAGLRAILDS